MFKSKKYHYLLRACAGVMALLVFLSATNPNQIALGLLVVPVLIATFIVYELTRFVFSVSFSDRKAKRPQAISLIIAIGAGLLLMLQSIGQLAPGDLAIVIFFILISIFYASRFR